MKNERQKVHIVISSIERFQAPSPPQSSGDSIRALRKVNVALTEEMHSMRRVCAALDEQCRAANMRAQFKDDIIKEMRRQLKQAKAKVNLSNATLFTWRVGINNITRLLLAKDCSKKVSSIIILSINEHKRRPTQEKY